MPAIRSPLRPAIRAPLRSPLAPALGGSPSLTAQVQALFAGGKVGGMWDMGDIATLFQDAAGATPVTAVTQPIGRVNDKSGNGNHATQATAGARPLYQVVSSYGCAQFDGVKDLLQVSGINLSAVDKVLVGLAFKSNSPSLGMLAEYSPNSETNPGSFYVTVNEGGAGKSFFKANNGGAEDIVMNTSAMAATNATLVAYIDLARTDALSKITARINGAAAALSTIADAADSPGNLGNYDLFLGARSGSSVPSNMNLYRAFVLADSSTAGEQLILENWLRESCGV